MDIEHRSTIGWGSILGGALTASALFAVFVGFGSSLGLATASSAPTWQDASPALWALSGLYLVLASLMSFGLGGYVAGRLHPHQPLPEPDENEMRAGMHGLLVWALAVIIAALLTIAGARTLAPAMSPAGAGTGQSSSLGAENLLAFELDRLFRSERRAADQDLTYARSEAGRILLTGSGHRDMAAEDRSYLVRLVGAKTGLAAPEAEQRVSAVVGQARASLSRARKAGIFTGFMIAAALLMGAAVCWFASQRGERDSYGDEISPYDAMFRSTGVSGWFGPARRRESPGHRSPPLG